MQPNPNPDAAPNSKFWVVVERIGSLAGVVGLVVAGAFYLWSLPLLAVVAMTCLSLGVLLLAMVARVFALNAASDSVSLFDGEPIPWPKVIESHSPARLPAANTAAETISRLPSPANILDEIQQRYELIKLEPNLVLLSGKEVAAHDGEDGAIVGTFESGKSHFRVAVQPYHNAPTNSQKRKRIAPLGAVSAQLTYTFYDGSKPTTIYHGAWLSEKDNKIDFPINSKHSLIIATIENAESDLYALERDFDGAHPTGITWRTRLPEDEARVEVRLISQADGSIVQTSQLHLLVTRTPQLVTQVSQLLVWKIFGLSKLWAVGHKLRMRVYEIFSETHEKLMASGNVLDPDVLAERDQREREMMPELEQWQQISAAFLGRYISANDQKSFLEAFPSLEMGLKRTRRRLLRLDPNKYEKQNWDFTDSINVRMDVLDRVNKGLEE